MLYMPPGADGATMVTVRSGYSCAAARGAASTNAAKPMTAVQCGIGCIASPACLLSLADDTACGPSSATRRNRRSTPPVTMPQPQSGCARTDLAQAGNCGLMSASKEKGGGRQMPETEIEVTGT